MTIPLFSRAVGRRLLVAMAVFAAVGVPIHVEASNLTWDGGDASSNNWNVGLNWEGDLAPVAGDVLFFGGTTRLTPSNDFTANTLFNGIAFNDGAGAFTLSGNAINLGGNLVNNSTNVQTINNALALTNNIVANTAQGGVTLGGLVSGAYSITKEGSGTLIFNGVSNTFNGGLIINAGTVRGQNITRALGALDNVITLNGGNLELAHTSSSSQNFGNNVAVQADGYIASDRVGSAQTYTLGTLSIGANNLTIKTGSSTTSGTGGITFGAVTLTGNATFTVAASTVGTLGAIGDGGNGYGFTKEGAGILTVTGTSTNTGQVTLNEGTLRGGATDAFGTGLLVLNAGTVATNSNTSRVYGNSNVSIAGDITFGEASTGTGAQTFNGLVTLTGERTLSFMRSTSFAGGVVGDDDLILNSAASTGTATLSSVNNSGTITNSGTGTGTVSIGSIGTDVTGVIQNSATSMLSLTGASSYTGPVTVSQGTLQLANASSLLADILNNGIVDFNRGTSSSYMLYEGVVSGTGAVTKSGNGRTVLSEDQTYTGGTTINAGILQIGNNGATGSVLGDIVNNGTLYFASTGTHAYTSTISGTGAVSVLNGTVILRGANTNAGAYTLSNGSTLELDFTAAGAPDSNILNNAANNSGLVFTGGRIVINGADGEANSQQFNGVTSSGGGGRLTALAGEGGTLSVSLGATSLTSNGAVSIVKNAGTTITTTTAADTATGIYSGRMVINDGTGWNFVTSTDMGDGNYQLSALTSYADLVSSGSITTNGGNAYLEDSGALTGIVSLYTLKIDTTEEGGILDLGGSRINFNATVVGGSAALPGALLFVGDHDYEIANGEFNRNGDNPRTIIIQQYGEGVLTISARITNGTPGAATSFAKAGSGELVLSGTNTYDGTTTIQEGILSISSAANVAANTTGGASNGMTIYGGATLRATETFALESADGTVKRNIVLAGDDAKIDVTAGKTFTVNGVLSGTYGGLNKTGLGALVLGGANTYLGSTIVSVGTLVVNGSLSSSSPVEVKSGATLGGSGSVGRIAGAGRVATGNSAGIMSAISVDQSTGLDYAFEFTLAGSPVWSNATASGNDVLRLTDTATPILSAATSDNVFALYFAAGGTYLGGVFTDQNSDFMSLVSGATYLYYVLDAAGSYAYNGQQYRLLNGEDVSWTTVQVASADFASGTVTDGWTQQFTVVPEPSTWLLLAFGAGIVFFARSGLNRAFAFLRCRES